MSYGLRTWNAKGVLELDTNTFTYQVIHNQVYQLTLRAVLTVPIAGFTPANCVATILPITPPNTSYNSCYDSMPYMSVGNGQVVVRSQNPMEPDANNGSTIQFRLLVMRYKN